MRALSKNLVLNRFRLDPLVQVKENLKATAYKAILYTAKQHINMTL